MTLVITTSDLDTLTRLHHAADEMAKKLRLELADHATRVAILQEQITKIDGVKRTLADAAHALNAAKPDALEVVRCDPGLLRGRA